MTEPVAFFYADAAGAIVQADPALAHLLDADDPLGQLVWELAFPGNEDAKSWFAGLGETASRYAAAHPTGKTRRWLEVTARREDTADGKFGIRGVLRDSTPEHEAVERYQSLIDHSPFGVVIIQDGIVVYANQAQELRWPSLGRPAADVLKDSMHPEDYRLVMDRIGAREAGAEVPSNYRFRTLRGDKIEWHEVWSSKVEYRGRTAIQAMRLDVTEAMIAEDQLRHAQKMEAVGRLAGGVAHDFNNLLTVILASAAIAKDAPNMLDLSSELEQVEQAALRASQLTRQLLTFSRRQPIHPEVFDLNDRIDGIRRMLVRLVGEHIPFDVSLAEASLPIRIDGGQLDQVVTNLVINGRDALRPGGSITIETGQIEILPSSPHPSGSYVSLTVSDDGRGIEAEDISKIFDPFFTTKEPGKGTGLGLSTVLGIIKGSGGFVDVDSTVGVGTRITAYVPRWEGGSVAGSKVADPSPKPRGGTILLVEDDDAVRRIVRRILERAGFEVCPSSRGAEALTHLDGGLTPDLVISDVLMPEMSGVELEAKLAQRFPGLPVLLLTGHADDEIIPTDRVGSLLMKPFRPNVLVERVSNLIADSASSRRDREA